MIYLNNAGTSYPKPKEVSIAQQEFNLLLPHQWNGVFEEGLETVTRFFNLPSKNRFIFTTSCTSSLAIALSDFAWQKGDRLIISHLEHHALSRWFHKLQQSNGVEGVVIPRTENAPFDLDLFEQELKEGAKLVAVTMASNVTGELLPFKEIIELAHQYGAKCLLDGAQTAGVLPIDITQLNPDFFVFAGHKGPLGIQGIGGLYIAKEVQMICPSAACEIDLESKSHSIFPSYCDTGSANMMGMAALNAGLQWLEKQGWDTLVSHRKSLVKQLRKGLEENPTLQILGTANEETSTGTVSVISSQHTPTELGNLLWEKHQIKVGTGFQCAPMAHEALGTEESGCLRFSVSPMSKEEEIEILIKSLKTISKS